MQLLKIKQFKENQLKTIEDKIAEESLLHVEINKETNYDTVITPENIKEFVFGNLYSEGIIKNKEEVLSYYEKKNSIIIVKIEIDNFEKKRTYLKRNYNIIWTECSSALNVKRLGENFEKIVPKIKVNCEDILKIPNKVSLQSQQFRETGAYHYTFLFNEKIEEEGFSYDVGRHNAVDKVIGNMVLNGKSLEDKILYTTGRITLDIVLKCLRARIPLVISKSAPLLNSVNLARKYNLGLIGFLRGERFNVYSANGVLE